MSADQTTAGFWLEARPRIVQHGADFRGIAELVLEALRETSWGVETPLPVEVGDQSELHALAGVRSYRAFTTGAVVVAVEMDDGSDAVTLRPMRNLGPGRGFDYSIDGDVTVTPDAIALANGLEVAVSAAR